MEQLYNLYPPRVEIEKKCSTRGCKNVVMRSHGGSSLVVRCYPCKVVMRRKYSKNHD